MELKTEYQREKEALECQVYNDYCELAANASNSRTMIVQHLMEKYGIHSMSTIYSIIKRRQAKEEEQQ